ncbi:MAG: hypothetical protein Q7R81_06115 [Candidatus Peregrinibacteria bacterium]|nr:hypothetical protein [Candidatus Peregrinibacteria bacterium]
MSHFYRGELPETDSPQYFVGAAAHALRNEGVQLAYGSGGLMINTQPITADIEEGFRQVLGGKHAIIVHCHGVQIEGEDPEMRSEEKLALVTSMMDRLIQEWNVQAGFGGEHGGPKDTLAPLPTDPDILPIRDFTPDLDNDEDSAVSERV